MYRRASAAFRGRSSVFVTTETRGVPYKVVSIVLGVAYLFFGLRNVFFCGYQLPVGAGEALIMEMWQTCKADPAMQIFEGLHGLGDWLIAIVRFSMAFTGSTASLFHTMLILGLYSIGFFVGAVRAGLSDVALYYSVLMFIGLFYENYVCYIAYRAYKSRLKMKQLENETTKVPYKVLFLVYGACWALYALKFFFACERPYLLFATEAEKDFFDSTWHDCVSHPRPSMRDGWGHMAGVHAAILAGISFFLFFTESMTTMWNGTALLTFYNVGIAFVIVKAGGIAVVPLLYLAVLGMGLVYNAYVLLLASNYLGAQDNGDGKNK